MKWARRRYIALASFAGRVDNMANYRATRALMIRFDTHVENIIYAGFQARPDSC